MSFGSQTPRQKMINLMYIVLMALLALNVSSDVLRGFTLVDESLTRTTNITVHCTMHWRSLWRKTLKRWGRGMIKQCM